MDKNLRTRIESAINGDEQRFDYGTDIGIVRAYEPSGLYMWLKLTDGRDATYYPESGRVVCHEPTPYAIDVRVTR